MAGLSDQVIKKEKDDSARTKKDKFCCKIFSLQ